jgi:solute carrier family 25 oxoglutarate transporter 11
MWAMSPAKDVPAQAKSLPRSVIFATSGLGGCLGWVIVHPANTLAVRTNLASMQGKKFSFSAMVKESGIMSLYDGLPAGILRQVFYASARFGLFETFRDKLHEIRGKTDFASR